jgi:hypothetical protein
MRQIARTFPSTKPPRSVISFLDPQERRKGAAAASLRQGLLPPEIDERPDEATAAVPNRSAEGPWRGDGSANIDHSPMVWRWVNRPNGEDVRPASATLGTLQTC